jgi:hypothetical protein
VIWFSAPVVGYQIVANVVLLFERGWITAKLGSEALTYYVVPMTPGILLHGFAFSAMITLFPVVERELTIARSFSRFIGRLPRR